MLQLNIKELRKNGKDPVFCERASSELLDEIITELLRTELDNETDATDLIATISNILLINSDLRERYFTPKYSAEVLDYMDKFINSTLSKNEMLVDLEFHKLVPVYRIVFLILYNRIDHIEEESIKSIYALLILGFEFCYSVFPKCKNDQFCKLAFIEVLKCLYTFHHKHSYGELVVEANVDGQFISEGLFHSCVITVNHIMEGKKDPILLLSNDSLLTKYLLNCILGLSGKVPKTENNDNETYRLFFHNLVSLLSYQLTKHSNHAKNDVDFEYSDLITIFVIISYMATKITTKYKNTTDLEIRSNLLSLQSIFINNILPKTSDGFIYNKLIILISLSNNTTFAIQNESISNMKNLSYLKDLILECFYSLSWTPENNLEEQILNFLDVVGYINAKEFIRNNELYLSPEVDTNNYLYPKSSYLDDANRNMDFEYSRTVLSSIFGNNFSNKPESCGLTDEEKELEAEKLYVIFDRMEKSKAFDNFTNPVREWQHLGKFEDLPDSAD